MNHWHWESVISGHHLRVFSHTSFSRVTYLLTVVSVWVLVYLLVCGQLCKLLTPDGS